MSADHDGPRPDDRAALSARIGRVLAAAEHEVLGIVSGGATAGTPVGPSDRSASGAGATRGAAPDATVGASAAGARSVALEERTRLLDRRAAELDAREDELVVIAAQLLEAALAAQGPARRLEALRGAGPAGASREAPAGAAGGVPEPVVRSVAAAPGPSSPGEPSPGDEGQPSGGWSADPPESYDSARLVALNMAAEGRGRDEVEAHLRDHLGIVGHAALIDYVFGGTTPSSVVPGWPPRRRLRTG